jgi:V/A-type H+-transporting ATPase subunit F
MSKVAVVGDKDSVLVFKALGVAAFPVTNTEEANKALNRVQKEKYAVVFITEAVAREVQPTVEAMNRLPHPAVVLIPNNRGTTGLGMQLIKKNAEKAIGVDILFGKEGG